ncbi:hypothetical protein K8R14_02235 [bacterium]|nr:hypothetical protein [bacterium]
MKIIIITLLFLVVTLSGCVSTTYTGTYKGGSETITLFDDGTFSVQDGDHGFSGIYEIMDGKLYLKHPLAAVSLRINETGIFDENGRDYIKQ